MISTAQQKRGVFSNVICLGRIFRIVVMKLIAPRIDLIPARWREKIVISMDILLCEDIPARGG